MTYSYKHLKKSHSFRLYTKIKEKYCLKIRTAMLKNFVSGF